jgi:DUF971 family protein
MSSDLHLEAAPVAPPSEVLVHQRSRRLELRWPDGAGVTLGHARLRSACKCAWCEGRRRRSGQDARCEEGITVQQVTPVGEVGLQLHFSDGHDKGIYPWSYLLSLGGR